LSFTGFGSVPVRTDSRVVCSSSGGNLCTRGSARGWLATPVEEEKGEWCAAVQLTGDGRKRGRECRLDNASGCAG
jgi:hypothetical protein